MIQPSFISRGKRRLLLSTFFPFSWGNAFVTMQWSANHWMNVKKEKISLLGIFFMHCNHPHTAVKPLDLWNLQGWAGIPAPSIPKNKSLWFPFPNYGNGFFFCSRSRILGMFFFIPFPSPKCENDFSFPSRSRIVEMIFHSLPVPKLWKWFFIHFPFPNLPFHGNQNGNWNTVRDSKLPIFLASSTFLSTIYIEVVN